MATTWYKKDRKWKVTFDNKVWYWNTRKRARLFRAFILTRVQNATVTVSRNVEV